MRLRGCTWRPTAGERLTVSADKTLSWSYTEDFTAEDEATAQARIRGLELGITPVSSGTGAALQMLAASVGAKSVAEVGTGTGVSGLWLLGGMGSDGVLTTIDVEPELQREARRAFDGAGYPSSRTRIIQGRASDVMPRMAARSYDMVVLDVAPEDAILLASNALRPAGDGAGGLFFLHVSRGAGGGGGFGKRSYHDERDEPLCSPVGGGQCGPLSDCDAGGFWQYGSGGHCLSTAI